MNDIERLLQVYQDEMKRLIEINEKRDYSKQGDKEFHQQSENVFWAKNALVIAESKKEIVS